MMFAVRKNSVYELHAVEKYCFPEHWKVWIWTFEENTKYVGNQKKQVDFRLFEKLDWSEP